MIPNISEFSYGYALTSELIHWHGTSIQAAPVFPSTYREGQKGGGYEVKLERPGMPLFLQFKLSHYMVRNNAKEARDGGFAPPFYRMHLRSRQYEMLLELEDKGNEVFYSAPAFHTSDEFNEAYLLHQVKDRSFWIKPSKIREFSDEPKVKDHHVAFDLGRTPYFCSKPHPLDIRGDFQEVEESVFYSFNKKSGMAMKREMLEKTARHLSEIVGMNRNISFQSDNLLPMTLEELHPLDQIAYFSQVFLGAQLFIVMEQIDVNGAVD